MGTYRDERQAALQRAEALAEENVQLQAELGALRQGKKPRASRSVRFRGSGRAALVVGAALAATMGLGSGFQALARRAREDMQGSQTQQGAWTPPDPVVRGRLRARVRAEGGTWVVGDWGAIYFQREGSSVWTTVPSGTQADLHSITAGPPLMVVGARGTALRFVPTERRWIAETTGSTADLHAVATRRYDETPASIVAVGEGRTMLTRTPEGVWMELHLPNRRLPLGSRPLNEVQSAEGDFFTHVALGEGHVLIGVNAEWGARRVYPAPVITTLRAVESSESIFTALCAERMWFAGSGRARYLPCAANTDALLAVYATQIPDEAQHLDLANLGTPRGFLGTGARGALRVDR